MSYALVNQLLQRGMTEAAQKVSAMLAEREQNEPLDKARAHELDWLVNYVKRGTTLNGSAWQGEGEDREPTRYEPAGVEVKALTAGQVPREGYIVIGMCPRLASLLKGELPSERAYREGRTP